MIFLKAFSFRLNSEGKNTGILEIDSATANKVTYSKHKSNDRKRRIEIRILLSSHELCQ